ncbi:MAG: ChaN family lipoprotein [Bacteriovoracaceae bacterium]|jgi:hypothetical protein|nr:ChaN family lipoprotein [Bacteriovoracaceae bacterium]
MAIEIIELQKRIYRNIKKKALSFEVSASKDLKLYRQNQTKFSKMPFKVATSGTLLKAVGNSDLIYLGDFHTFDQNSRNLERVMRHLTNQKKNLILGLEMVDAEHQDYLDAFLSSNITELEFLESIEYHDSWRFPWNHYKDLFKEARKQEIPIYGLNSKGTLEERDKFAAEKIQALMSENQDSKMLILFGELHILSNKLPKKVQKLLKDSNIKKSHTIIHQNLDHVYWKLKDAKIKSSIVKFSNSEFSIQSSPPWIKYESMVYWYENLIDDPDFDIHEYIMETGSKTFSSSTVDQFHTLCHEIYKSLNLRPHIKDKIENFTLYDHRKIDFIQRQIDKIKDKKSSTLYQKLLTTSKLFKIPFTSSYYCPLYSINRLSYLAGAHLYFSSLIDPNEFDQCLISGSREKKFLAILNLNISCYISSKIINPHRKCDHYRNLIKKRDHYKKTKSSEYKAYQVATELLDETTSVDQIFKNCSLSLYWKVGSLIGHLLGDILFDKLHERNPDKVVTYIRDHIFISNMGELKWETTKNHLLPTKAFKMRKKRFF